MPLQVQALIIGIVSAILTFFVWFGLIVLAGFFTDSGAFGICGPYGPCSGVLVIMFFALSVVSPAGGFIVARI
jgi:hypothetical protein